MPDTTHTPTRATATRKAASAKRSGTATKAEGAPGASTASTASTTSTATKGPRRVVETAERAALVQLGATLTARDAVIDALRTSPAVAGKGVQAGQRRFERELDRYAQRGATARGRVEADLRKAGDRVTAEIQGLGRHATSTGKELAASADAVSSRVGRVVQSGFDAGSRTASKVGARLPFGD